VRSGLALALALLAVPVGGGTTGEEGLLAGMGEAGLERVELLAGTAVRMARGRLPGDGPLVVVLFAGCGPGAVAGRNAAIEAAADLARTPRRHTLELALCVSAEPVAEAAALAAGDWLDLFLDAGAGEQILAALHLEIGDSGVDPVVGLLPAGVGAGGRSLPPAWLAHAALVGSRSAGARLQIGSSRWSLLAQLLSRYGRSRASSGAGLLLSEGVPALALSGRDGGAGTGEGWPAVVAAVVRRLDGLAGRPRDDDVYLALGGRIWTRRDLYWVGLAAWIAQVAGGLPGAWRGAGGLQRRRRGRRYLPGFALRVLFLAALLLAPVATLVLLAPAALLTLPALHRRAVVAATRWLAVTPALMLAGYWAVALAAGEVEVWPAQPLRMALVLGSLGLAVSLIGRPRRSAPPGR
jgi:hypothetical protein